MGQLNGLNTIPNRIYGNSYKATITANAALARIIKYLFKNASVLNISRIDSLESAHEKLYSANTSQQVVTHSRDYGRAVADAVFNWSLTDGGFQGYLDNFPVIIVPLPGWINGFQHRRCTCRQCLPYRGNIRPIVFANGAGSVDPPNPPLFAITPASAFYDAAYEVYTTGLHPSAEQNIIALFWADGTGTFTPPGHNIAITLQIIRNHNLNLYEATVLLAKVGVALNDAAIVCWRAKYKLNLLRPITYIQNYIHPLWKPLISTPPFPGYTSGHSTFSAAAAVLTAEIGNQVPFTDSSKISNGFHPPSISQF